MSRTVVYQSGQVRVTVPQVYYKRDLARFPEFLRGKRLIKISRKTRQIKSDVKKKKNKKKKEEG